MNQNLKSGHHRISSESPVASILIEGLESMADGFGIIDQSGNLIYLNPAALKLHGLPIEGREKYLGRSWLDLYSTKGRAQIEREMLPALATHKYWTGRTPVERLDGGIVSMDISASTLPNGYVIGIMRDISAQVRVERERDITQREYYQTQKMEAIGRMAGGIAHDFNNLFASIIGYVEFLLEDLDPQTRQHHFARQVMDSVTDARGIVDRISQVSRYNERVLSKMDVVSTVESIVKDHDQFSRVSFKSGTETLPARLETARFKKVIYALIQNAIEAGGSSEGVHVSVSQERPSDEILSRMMAPDLPSVNYVPKITIVPGPARGKGNFLMAGILSQGCDYVVIEVLDQGFGMSAQVMERIFEPFFTTKSALDKSGLGLSAVLAFCAAHQSAMTVSSREEHGAVFRLYVPVVDYGTYYDGIDAQPTESPLILLVEDDSAVSEVMCEMIERLDYEVVACSGVAAALEILRENPDSFSLAITDYMMPQSSGVDFARRLRAEFPNLPVILMSGYSPEKFDDIMHENPSVRGFLPKPIESADLQDVISRVLRSGS